MYGFGENHNSAVADKRAGVGATLAVTLNAAVADIRAGVGATLAVAHNAVTQIQRLPKFNG